MNTNINTENPPIDTKFGDGLEELHIIDIDVNALDDYIRIVFETLAHTYGSVLHVFYYDSHNALAWVINTDMDLSDDPNFIELINKGTEDDIWLTLP